MKMCSAFCRQGASVVLVHIENPRLEIPMNSIEIKKFYNADDRLEIVKISRFPFCRASVYAYRAARVAVAHRAELAFCRDVYSCLHAMRRGIDSFVELHDLPAVDSQTGKALKKIFRRPNLQAVVVITESLKKALLETYSIEKDKVIVCPDAADDLSECVPKLFDGAYQTHVGYLGSLQTGKGMEIIAELPALCPEICFHVVGGSSEQIADWRSKLSNHNNILFHGHVPPSESGEYLAGFNIALAPNQEKVIVRGGTDIGKFTSPMKLFEYMSAGKPIIASDLPVLKEVLRHDDNAWLCNPESPEDWKEAIQKLSKEGELATRLATSARADFEKLYTWDVRAQRVIAAFETTRHESVRCPSN